MGEIPHLEKELLLGLRSPPVVAKELVEWGLRWRAWTQQFTGRGHADVFMSFTCKSVYGLGVVSL